MGATQPIGGRPIGTLPTFQLRPGINIDEAKRLLEERAINVRSEAQPMGMEPGARLVRNAYVKAATTTETRLRSILSIRDSAALFEGPRHRDICSMEPGEQVLQMISAEIDALTHRLGTMALELQNARNLFADGAKCIVLDTNFYVEHPEMIDKVDFHKLTGLPGAINVLIPMVVIDELDGLKKTPKRGRATYSLAVIDNVVSDPPSAGLLAPGQANPPRGAITMQIVFDSPDHVRLPINDDEIVDRCIACEPYSGPITVVTYDTGLYQRARAARLDVKKLRKADDAVPEDAT